MDYLSLDPTYSTHSYIFEIKLKFGTKFFRMKNTCQKFRFFFLSIVILFYSNIINFSESFIAVLVSPVPFDEIFLVIIKKNWTNSRILYELWTLIHYNTILTNYILVLLDLHSRIEYSFVVLDITGSYLL